ncbi:cytidine/deoxycytidylate deaminase family protein [Streptomyces wuyuanensis]|uniref:hypothetical protein n=1 Tax=Streptomyces wuyuanensis TaxID=1196353 RepID=UPI0036978E38
MRLALRVAASSPCRQKMGAVVVQGRRVITFKSNTNRNPPGIDFLHATFHAEEAALRRVQHTAGSVVYVARVGAKGEPALARPCFRCQKFMSVLGVTKAYYTDDSGATKHLSLKRWPEPLP